MVFVEYVMLAGVNDSFAQAAQLADDPRPAHVQGQPDPVQPDRLGVHRLEPQGDRGVQATSSSAAASSATVRLTRGRDIDAACGQLAARSTVPADPMRELGLSDAKLPGGSAMPCALPLRVM